jgi:hypothetical protein
VVLFGKWHPGVFSNSPRVREILLSIASLLMYPHEWEGKSKRDRNTDELGLTTDNENLAATDGEHIGNSGV